MKLLKYIYNKFFPGSTLAHRLFWRYRYTLAKKTLSEQEMNNDLNHPHRNEIIKELGKFSGINKILEIGSSWGPNLVLINRNNPHISSAGIDISKYMVDIGNEYFRKNNLQNINLIFGDMTSINKFSDNEFDLVLSDAALIYVDNKKITRYAEELIRISRSGLIIVEFDNDSNDPYGKIFQATWIRDYEALFKKYATRISKRSISSKIWPGKWAMNGKIITVFLNNTGTTYEKTFKAN